MFGVYCTRPPRKLNQLKHGIKKRQSARARQRPLYTRTFQRRQPDMAMAITVIPERPSPTRLLNQFDERHEFNPDFFPSVGKFLAQRVQPSLDAVYSTIGARVPLAEGPLPTRKLNQLKHGCGADSFSPEWNRNAAGPYRAVIMNKHVVPGPTTLSPQFRLKSYGYGRFHRSLRFQTLFAATPRQAADVPGSRSLFLLGCPNDVTPAIDVVWPVSPMFRRLRTALHVVTSKFKLRGEVPRPTALLPGDCIHTARSLTFGCHYEPLSTEADMLAAHQALKSRWLRAISSAFPFPVVSGPIPSQGWKFFIVACLVFGELPRVAQTADHPQRVYRPRKFASESRPVPEPHDVPETFYTFRDGKIHEPTLVHSPDDRTTLEFGILSWQIGRPPGYCIAARKLGLEAGSRRGENQHIPQNPTAAALTPDPAT
ncbi:hypothetical protein DFH09DRAFT_1505771 [Mycena vulgaris]|nr:hypothetical protein DFH09DRAFT_1505771 [Mycena vulgaris]